MPDDVDNFYQNPQPQPVKPKPETANPAATQSSDNPADTIFSQPSPPGTNNSGLDPTIKETILKLENILLRTLSVLLIIHGLRGLYEEFINLFYVFPHLPEIYQLLNYSTDIYESVYRRSAIITGTALIETIYGAVLITRHSKLIHRLHIFSALSILVISVYLLRGLPSLELDQYESLPKPPSVENLIEANSFRERLELFQNIRFKPADIPALQATPSAQIEN